MTTNLVVFKILFLVLIARRITPATGEHLVQVAGSSLAHWTLDEPQDTNRALDKRETSSDTRQDEEVNTENESSSSLTPTREEQNEQVANLLGLQLRQETHRRQSEVPIAEHQVATSEGVSPAPNFNQNQAELCYLADGKSSLTLTVNEATQIGSIIGTIDVNGNPSIESGNVELMDEIQSQEQTSSLNHQLDRLQAINSKSRSRVPRHRQQNIASDQSNFYSLINSAPNSKQVNTHESIQNPPVRLESGTRNLVLVRKLDKESPEGESSLVINIRCKPKVNSGTNSRHQESTTIPVRIIITDANDHAPEFVGSLPYIVNVSETSPIGSVASRDILAQDRDSAGPFSTIHYRVLDDGSAHWHLLQFSNPLDPTLIVSAPIDFESLGSSFSITILASDLAEPEPLTSTTQVQINVIDFDDQNPKFLDDKYTLVMDESQQSSVGQNLQVSPRDLCAEDGDKGIKAPILYSFDGLDNKNNNHHNQATANGLTSDDSSGEDHDGGFTIGRYLHLNPTSGQVRLIRQWPSRLASSQLTLVVRATQADNSDRYALTTLTISSRSQANPSTSSQRSSSANSTGANSNGIAFSPNKLVVNVPESAQLNDKIAQVKAKFMAKSRGDSEPSDSSLAVDLMYQHPTDSSQVSVARNKSSSKLSRPISYQILDDQGDQFAINGLGEIYLKKSLDYEAKQEHKFRVLATYAKHSDICQIQVNVINVNDNKPKFTQPQYSFHLTESRLRSNLIGEVKALDADLNDTIRYSLAGEHATLFEINQLGQVSLRSSIKQLNVTRCQLLAQATDSLGPVQNTQQARINLQVAPQLIGRSLNLEPLAASSIEIQTGHRATGDSDSKAFNARSLTTETSADPTFGLNSNTTKYHLNNQILPSSQRSSMATIVSSLQHMARSVNLIEMPISSALLLSALLAFLVCLLFIVIISMSVHFYRRHTKSNRRRQMAAAAHLRHAHLTGARLQVPGLNITGPGGPISLGSGNARQYSATGSSSPGENSVSSPHGSSPINCASNEQLSRSREERTQMEPNVSNEQISKTRIVPKLTARVSPSQVESLRSVSQQSFRGPLKTLNVQMLSAKGTPGNSMSPKYNSRLASGPISPVEAQVRQTLGQETPTNRWLPESSLISTISSQSKRSYASNTTDNSSVMHCGHYSLKNVDYQKSPDPQYSRQYPKRDRNKGPQANSGCSPVEAAIRSLAQEPTHRTEEAPSRRSTGDLVTSLSDPPGQQRRAPRNELNSLVNSKPGMKSYRKLPTLMGSLVRPTSHLENLESQATKSELTNECQRDSAIVSDASSSGRSQVTQKSQNSTLMAMIREPNLRPTSGGTNFMQTSEYPQAIKWPLESIPQRVKKLTWDDELSLTGEFMPDNDGDFTGEPYVGSCVQFKSNCVRQFSSTDGNFDYDLPIEAHKLNDIYAGDSNRINGNAITVEQQFLFNSNPVSPVVNVDPEDHIYQEHLGNVIATHKTSANPAMNNSNYRLQDENSSITIGQNNCLDYTIVQSSQFHVDSLAFATLQENREQKLIRGQIDTNNNSHYAYSKCKQPDSNVQFNGYRQVSSSDHQDEALKSLRSDLKLMTTAVL